MRIFVATVLIGAFASLPFVASGIQEEVVRIEIGRDYDDHSNRELRRRVYQLERAVYQLQMKVFQLEHAKPPAEEKSEWTCRISSFGKTHVSSAKTKAKALAEVIRKCSEGSNSIHCQEKDASCGNE